MATTYRWNKKFFSNINLVYREGRKVGQLSENSFRRTAEGELEGMKCRFNTRGLSDQRSQVLSHDGSEELAAIHYNGWKTSASIQYRGKDFTWENANIWRSHWRISCEGHAIVDYHGGPYGGSFDSYEADPFLMLTGLFISNYFRESTVAVFVVLFIVIIAGG